MHNGLMCGKKDGETDLLKDKEVMTRNLYIYKTEAFAGTTIFHISII